MKNSLILAQRVAPMQNDPYLYTSEHRIKCVTLIFMKMLKKGPLCTKNIIENNENLQIKLILGHIENMLGGSSENHGFLTQLS